MLVSSAAGKLSFLASTLRTNHDETTRILSVEEASPPRPSNSTRDRGTGRRSANGRKYGEDTRLNSKFTRASFGRGTPEYPPELRTNGTEDLQQIRPGHQADRERASRESPSSAPPDG